MLATQLKAAVVIVLAFLSAGLDIVHSEKAENGEIVNNAIEDRAEFHLTEMKLSVRSLPKFDFDPLFTYLFDIIGFTGNILYVSYSYPLGFVKFVAKSNGRIMDFLTISKLQYGQMLYVVTTLDASIKKISFESGKMQQEVLRIFELIITVNSSVQNTTVKNTIKELKEKAKKTFVQLENISRQFHSIKSGFIDIYEAAMNMLRQPGYPPMSQFQKRNRFVNPAVTKLLPTFPRKYPSHISSQFPSNAAPHFHSQFQQFTYQAQPSPLEYVKMIDNIMIGTKVWEQVVKDISSTIEPKISAELVKLEKIVNAKIDKPKSDMANETRKSVVILLENNLFLQAFSDKFAEIHFKCYDGLIKLMKPQNNYNEYSTNWAITVLPKTYECKSTIKPASYEIEESLTKKLENMKKEVDAMFSRMET